MASAVSSGQRDPLFKSGQPCPGERRACACAADSSRSGPVMRGWERKWERATLAMAQHCLAPLMRASSELSKHRAVQVVVSVVHSWGSRGRQFIRHAEGMNHSGVSAGSGLAGAVHLARHVRFGSRMGAEIRRQVPPRAVIRGERRPGNAHDLRRRRLSARSVTCAPSCGPGCREFVPLR